MARTRILQLTDLHLFADPAERLEGIPTRELLEDVVAQLLAAETPPDHVVVTGDLAHDELPETYAAARELLAPWLDRLWIVPGNHDDRAGMRAAFPERIPETGAERISFAFRAGTWLCLGLDTLDPGEVRGVLAGEQIEWIRARLREERPDAVVLFMHHPPVELGVRWLDLLGLEGAGLLQALAVEEPRLRLVCCGHVHQESSHRVGGAEVVTTPSTGLQFSPVSQVPAFTRAPPGYRLIELDAGGYTTTVVRLPEARYSPSS